MDTYRVNRVRLILLGSLTILAIVSWIGIEVYQGVAEDRTTPQVQNELTPLDPSLNTTVLEELEPRRDIPIEFSNEKDS